MILPYCYIGDWWILVLVSVIDAIKLTQSVQVNGIKLITATATVRTEQLTDTSNRIQQIQLDQSAPELIQLK